MKINLTPFFDKYKAVVKMADDAFKRVKEECPECVTCEIKCADCCHALFDITLIEALYLNHQFHRKFKNGKLEKIIEKANRADRTIHQIKRKAYKDMQSGKDENDILRDLAEERCRCPLLNEKDLCDLYENRPITCRLYGIPTSIGGVSHTCGESGFEEGKSYPAVNLDAVQQWLFQISQELVAETKSKYTKMADMLVPVSMALLTVYDQQYLGIAEDPDDSEGEGKKDD